MVSPFEHLLVLVENCLSRIYVPLFRWAAYLYRVQGEISMARAIIVATREGEYELTSLLERRLRGEPEPYFDWCRHDAQEWAKHRCAGKTR